MKIKIIAAIGQKNELGKNNDLIWHIPGDLKFFKEVTSGHTVLMGKNTFYSLPKVLPNRKNIVISETKINNDEIIVYSSLEDFFKDYKDIDEEVFIIGGASMYKAFIDIASELYLTEIEATDDEAQVYFPDFDKTKYVSEFLKENSDNGIKYRHVLYKKVK